MDKTYSLYHNLNFLTGIFPLNPKLIFVSVISQSTNEATCSHLDRDHSAYYINPKITLSVSNLCDK